MNERKNDPTEGEEGKWDAYVMILWSSDGLLVGFRSAFYGTGFKRGSFSSDEWIQ